jgi:hypothetical protein
MTSPESRLRDALRTLAEAPAPPDPGPVVLRQAGRIRRRRTSSAGVAAAVAVAVTLLGVRAWIAAPASSAPARPPALAGPRFVVSGYYSVNLDARSGPSAARLFDPGYGQYRPVPGVGSFIRDFIPAPDGRHALLWDEHGNTGWSNVIAWDALLRGDLKASWHIPGSSNLGCRGAWTADGRYVLCVTDRPQARVVRVLRADVRTHQVQSTDVRWTAPAGQVQGPPEPLAGCTDDEILMLRENLPSQRGTVALYDIRGRLLRTYSARLKTLPYQPRALDCSPNGRLLLDFDGRAMDLGSGAMVGPGIGRVPEGFYRMLGWYDDGHYLRVDYDGAQSVLRVVDLYTDVIVRSLVLEQDPRYRWLPRISRLTGSPQPGQLVI